MQDQLEVLTFDVEAVNLLADEITQTGGSLLDLMVYDSENSTYSMAREVNLLDEGLRQQTVKLATLGERATALLQQCNDANLGVYALKRCQLGKILFLQERVLKAHKKGFIKIYLATVLPPILLLVGKVVSWLFDNFNFC